MTLQLILTLFYLSLFNYLIFRFPQFRFRRLKPIATHILFNLKFLTGIFIWAIYTFYYTDVQNNDVHKFYSDALVLNKSAFEQPHAFFSLMTGMAPDSSSAQLASQMKNWTRNFDEAPFNENHTIIRLQALIMFLSFRTYFVHILFMCFISLLGWVLAFNAVFQNSGKTPLPFAFLVMLLPSVLFWTSGVMKEPLLTFGLGLFTCGLMNLHNIKYLLYVLAACMALLVSKFFILAPLLPAAIAFWLCKNKDEPTSIIARYAGVLAFTLLLGFTVHRFIPRLNPAQMLVNKQRHSVLEAEYFKAGSRIAIPPIEPNALSILRTTPAAIWNTLLRPYPWEAKNIMMLASAVENLIVLLLLAHCLFYTDYKNFKHLNTILMLLCLSLGYFAIIGMCTPVLGNLVRYRAPLLPFFLFAFLLNLKPHGLQLWLAKRLNLLAEGAES